jgi:predicted metal-dependent phosphoesterase TrpH
VTDHDSVSGLNEAKKTGEKEGVEVIRGIELSTYKEGEVHVLGYGMRLDENFFSGLKKAKDMRRERNLEILDRLKSFGVKIEENELYDGSGEEKGRLHIARLLVAKKHARCVNEAFDEWIGANGKAFVRVKRFTPEEGVEMIARSGGIPVMAHPMDKRQREDFEPLVRSMKEAGLRGIEIFYPSHTPQDRMYYLSFAKKHNLLVTGGSDYHCDSCAIKIGAGNADLSHESIDLIRKTNQRNRDRK